MLKIDGIKLNEDLFLVNSLTRACKLQNDRVRTRLPIRKSMLETLVRKTADHFEGDSSQPYLSILYRTMFVTAYFGLFRIGEITLGTHPVLAQDMHIRYNKMKMMFILRSSKTYHKGNHPQIVKINSIAHENGKKDRKWNYHICPYRLLRLYAERRGIYVNKATDPFFVFADGSPVKPAHLRGMLKRILEESGFDSNLFTVHSFTIGQSNDLLKLGLSVKTIRKLGRWKSNAVFRYLRFS